MKRTQLINIICSLILASILVLGVLITVVIYSAEDGALIIESESAQREYNGNTLERHYYEIISGKLKNGHSVQASFTGEQTEIGTSDNIFSVKVVDNNGKDVTSRYEIELVFGKLNVLPIALTIETPSDDKAYDGIPLVRNEWMHKGDLLLGHTLNVFVTGSQTEIGISPNRIDRYSILDVNGYDVSKYYNVTLVEGDLVVYDPVQIGDSVGGGSSIDLSGNIGSGNSTGDESVCLKVKNEIDDLVYLKLKSFGSYAGKSWTDATPFDRLIYDMMSADYLSCLAIGKTASYIEIESFSGQYFLPYYMSVERPDNYTVQTSDVFYVGDTQNVYSLCYGKFDYGKNISLPSDYVGYEQLYREFVSEQYLDIDDETLNYMQSIMAKEGFYKKDMETVLKVADYIQKSAKYNLAYDRELDSENNVAVAFLDEYKEGVCQHYASAATLLYRAMGIPARYTVGFFIETTAGEWVEVKGRNAHAWVEVYVDNVGWIQIEVTGGFGGSGGNNGGGNIVYSAKVTPVRVDKVYDGTPLYAENIVDGFEKYEKLGFTYKAVVSGTRTELGKSNSIIESFAIYDPYGNDVTDKFDLSFGEGVIHVYRDELVFESDGNTKEYDALPLITDLSACRLVGGKLLEGENYTISDPVSITNAMTVAAGFKVVIRDAAGVDITDIYKITKKCGTLKITPRNITVKASDATKKYDGHALVSEYYTVIGDLGYGDEIFCVVEGSQTGIGRSENIVKDIIIRNDSGEDITNNYSIKTETGTLRVTP